MSENLNNEVEQAEVELLSPSMVDDTDVDYELVDNTVKEINVIFSRNFTTAMIEVGEYFIREFFDNDHELVKKNKPKKEKSFLAVIKKLKESGEKKPSKSWLYNAINLVVDSAVLNDFHSYGNLPLSSKIMLLRVKDATEKRKLAQSAVDGNLSVSQLGDMINQSKKPQSSSLQRYLKNEKFINETNIEDFFIQFNFEKLSDNDSFKAKQTIKSEIFGLEKMIKAKAAVLEKYKQIESKLESFSEKSK